MFRAVLYVDADFASDLHTPKSTSGDYICLVGPQPFFPIASLEHAVRNGALPLTALWDVAYNMCTRSGAKNKNNKTHKPDGGPAGGFFLPLPMHLAMLSRTSLRSITRKYLAHDLRALMLVLFVSFCLRNNYAPFIPICIY